MNEFEKMFKEQHPNYNKEIAKQQWQKVLKDFEKCRKKVEKENAWLSIEEINESINQARKERKNKNIIGA